ncbi:MAG TPA: KTSC domain-containing protein [Sphingomonadaceae bacterium]|jgi:hypothetical protein|nr:KTSC domain-containing protein [Sphingomonadaceae bacterium]
MPLVTSTAVARVEYDPAARVLDIWYKGGDRYSYRGVPPEVYAALLAAPSIGAFVTAAVKPRYPFTRAARRRFAPS